MRVKKVFLKNFKGVKDKKIIDFKNQSSLLIGPNGFGKTTIFDVLELCLTEEIYRTKQKDGVTNHSKDYKKPFFQNEEGEDVVIKVWLSKQQDGIDDDFIITKYLPKDHDGRIGDSGRRNKPLDFKLLSTYREKVETFYNDDFNPSEAELIKQKDIDVFFGFEADGFEIKQIYNLFNYLQQEETTFFLKMSEKDRKNKLGFLFQTSNQEDELSGISAAHSDLMGVQKKLNDKIDEIKKVEKVNGVEYKRVFPEREFNWDGKDLFGDIGIAESSELKRLYNKVLDEILQFTKDFSPDEYEKKQKIKLIDSKIKNTDLIDFYILQNLMEEKNYELVKKQRDILRNEEKIKAFILQNSTLNYKKYKEINNTRIEYEEFLQINDLDTRIKSLETFVVRFKPELVDSYKELLENRNQLIATTKEIDLTINEIIRMRNSISKELKKDINNIIDDDACPYCGKEWETAEKLLSNFEKREKTLTGLSTDQSNRLGKFETDLEENFIIPIIKQMNEYLEKHKKVDPRIFNLLKELKDKIFNFTELESYKFTKDMIWTQPLSYEHLLSVVTEMKKLIESEISVPDEVFIKMKRLKDFLLKTDKQELEEVVSKDILNQFSFTDLSKDITISDYKEKINQLISFLEKKRESYQYDHAKVQDSEGIYERYFSAEKGKFQSFDSGKIDEKKQYIKYLFSMKQTHLLDKYESRSNKLDRIIMKVDNTKKLYAETIKTYKKEMADNIKVPFYIYTAKMLQNYQQGMGVFLSTDEGKDTIRFLTDKSTDHDAIHHLSSGQLAVISLAFTLAINKTYNISDNLKFLTIDDPVQEMDALNIHSFIELIRHEFLEEYQFIFSTHSDTNALYMKYKFEKITNDPVSMINVQRELFD